MGARILIVDDSPTIRKIVAKILARRDYDPVLAADGVDALQVLNKEKVDLVLVDFVMPRMNGYQLCREIRARDTVKDLPVVLMSAKGDKIRGKFVERTGALDAITKPFDARGLVAVIESALKKQEQGGRAEGEPVSDDEPASSPTATSAMHSVQRTEAADALADALAPLLAPELERLDGVKGDERALAEALKSAITAESVRSLSRVLRTVDFGAEAGEVLSGDVSVISISEVLQLLDVQRQSGALTITSKRSRVTLFIGDGNLDFATYTGLPEEFLLGRYLVDSGAVSREELDRALGARRDDDARVLGDYLVEEELVTAEALERALQQQTSELIYEVVRWRKGRFRFLHRAENAMADQAKLQLRTPALIMEGFRRVDEWRLIEDSFDFNDILFRDDMAIDKLEDQERLQGHERAVLDAIDGESTVGEIVDAVEGSSFEICKVLYQLLNSRLVRRRAA